MVPGSGTGWAVGTARDCGRPRLKAARGNPQALHLGGLSTSTCLLSDLSGQRLRHSEPTPMSGVPVSDRDGPGARVSEIPPSSSEVSPEPCQSGGKSELLCVRKAMKVGPEWISVAGVTFGCLFPLFG